VSYHRFARWGVTAFLTLLVGFVMANPAVGILYKRTAYGNLESICTVSVVAGEDIGMEMERVLVTAAHCVNRDLVLDPGSELWHDNADWLVTFDEKAFVAAVTYRVGETVRGYDIAILTFVSEPPDVEPLRLGDWSTVELGSRLLNWANPLGIGLQRFEGYVSMLSLERPVRGAQIWWRHHGVAIVPGAGGSSGSLLLDVDGFVVGVLVGVIQAPMGTPFIVFVPVDRFEAFLENDHYGRPISPH